MFSLKVLLHYVILKGRQGKRRYKWVPLRISSMNTKPKARSKTLAINVVFTANTLETRLLSPTTRANFLKSSWHNHSLFSKQKFFYFYPEGTFFASSPYNFYRSKENVGFLCLLKAALNSWQLVVREKVENDLSGNSDKAVFSQQNLRQVRQAGISVANRRLWPYCVWQPNRRRLKSRFYKTRGSSLGWRNAHVRYTGRRY